MSQASESQETITQLILTVPDKEKYDIDFINSIGDTKRIMDIARYIREEILLISTVRNRTCKVSVRIPLGCLKATDKVRADIERLTQQIVERVIGEIKESAKDKSLGERIQVSFENPLELGTIKNRNTANTRTRFAIQFECEWSSNGTKTDSASPQA